MEQRTCRRPQAALQKVGDFSGMRTLKGPHIRANNRIMLTVRLTLAAVFPLFRSPFEPLSFIARIASQLAQIQTSAHDYPVGNFNCTVRSRPATTRPHLTQVAIVRRLPPSPSPPSA